MKTYFLVRNDDGLRFIPSFSLPHTIPCEVLGHMLIDDDFCFSVADLQSFNDVIRKVLINE